MLAAATVNTKRPLPVMKDHEVSPLFGFVPHEEPLERLPQDYFQPWEELADNLHGLIQSKRLREKVHQLPLLDTTYLSTVPEMRRAFQLLGFLSHSYVWGERDKPTPQSLPVALAEPWTKVAKELGLPPILTYASTNLWNWTLKDKAGEYELDNLKTLFTMTGTSDEDWFYIVAVAVEMAGGAALKQLLDAVQATRDNDVPVVVKHMTEALVHLQRIAGLLGRMFERCDPAVFYWQIRPFIQGTEPNAALGLPNGLFYEESAEPKDGFKEERDGAPFEKAGQIRKHMGVTAGQSSLFPALDIFYGIDHASPSSSDSDAATPVAPAVQPSNKTGMNGHVDYENSPLVAHKNRNPLLYKMKQYMPAPHRDFLNQLADVANLREFVDHHANAHPDLVQIYNNSVTQIQEFRSIHLRVATRYIILQAKRTPPPNAVLPPSASPLPAEEPEASSASGVKGTGGSDLAVFLRGLRDETAASKFA